MKTAHHKLFLISDHVITQIIKAELVVSSVGNVGVVGCLTLAALKTVDDETYLETEEAVDIY